MKKLLLAIMAVAALCSCNRGVTYTLSVEAPAEFATITLHDLFADEVIAVIEREDADAPFVYSGKLEAPTMAVILDDEDMPLTSLFIEKGDIVVTYDYDGNWEAAGTPSNDALVLYTEQMQELAESYRDADPDEVFEAYYDFCESLIEENSDKLFGVALLQNCAPMLEPEQILAYIDGMSKQMKELEVVKSLKEGAETKLKTAAGAKYIDFTAEDAEGNEVALSSLVGEGKWVLLDFWATWCGPCRGELPYLKAAYEKYADKGFEICGISLDSNVEAWKAFVPENGMVWVNLIDTSRSGAQNYAITSIPTNFLISPEGVIVATNLRGEGVEETLAEYLE